MGLIKTIGSSGQISLGKKFAGQSVMLEEIKAGVWIVKLGRFIPDSEQWLHGSQTGNLGLLPLRFQMNGKRGADGIPRETVSSCCIVN